MVKWEQELQTEFTLRQWQMAIQYSSKSSACVDHWDNAEKIFHRCHLTPFTHKQNGPN